MWQWFVCTTSVRCTVLNWWCSKCPRTGSISIIWEFIRNANSWALHLGYWIRNSGEWYPIIFALTTLPHDSHTFKFKKPYAVPTLFRGFMAIWPWCNASIVVLNFCFLSFNLSFANGFWWDTGAHTWTEEIHTTCVTTIIPCPSFHLRRAFTKPVSTDFHWTLHGIQPDSKWIQRELHLRLSEWLGTDLRSHVLPLNKNLLLT